MMYKVCNNCGAHLDSAEKCDCKEKSTGDVGASTSAIENNSNINIAEEMPKSKWYFTFGEDSKYSGRYMCLEGTFKEALSAIESVIGTDYAFSYNENDFVGKAEKYSLKPLTIWEVAV